MSKKLYEESNIQDIASAIRSKNGSSNQYTVAQMAGAVRAIITPPSLEALNVVANGDYAPSSDKDGFSSVHVDVPTGGADPVLQEKTATQNGIILPDTGYDGLSKVTVNVSGGAASTDNIIVGSSAPDASIGTPGDLYLQGSTNRVDGHAYHKIVTFFYKTSQNVWAKAPDKTLPYPTSSVRIITHSTGGSNASIDIYVDQVLVRNILYSSVLGGSAHSFDDLFGLFVGYNTGTNTPDARARNGWCIYTSSNISVKYNDNIISPDSIIENWTFGISVDFTIEV